MSREQEISPTISTIQEYSGTLPKLEFIKFCFPQPFHTFLPTTPPVNVMQAPTDYSISVVYFISESRKFFFTICPFNS